MEFLDVVESLRAEDASVERLFGGEGRSIHAGKRNSPAYHARLTEAANFVADVYQGRRPVRALSEALTTSDFPQLFGDIIDRQVLANYQEAPASWSNYCKRATVRDFRTVKRFRVDGGEGLLDTVAEQAPYPGSSVSDAEYTYSVAKYGRVMPFSWEAMINDDLDALKDVPQRFGRAARRTEERFATALFVDTNGPHASVFTSDNANIVNTTNGAATTNPALSITGLQDAYTVLGNMLDSGGDPITIEAYELIVPPALEVTAQNLLNATEIWATTQGGATGAELHMVNWMRSKVRLSVNAYIPIVGSGSNKNRMWFLMANPNSGRPGLELGFLRGHEQPEIFMKSPNATRVGGGSVDAMNGDFDTDSIEYKVRHVLGGSVLDPKMMVGSNGSGS